MKTVVCVLLHASRSCFRTRLALQAENHALRHQITLLQRGRKRLPLNAADRFLWICLSRLWVGWRSALAIFKPETVIRWQRTGFRLSWREEPRPTAWALPDSSGCSGPDPQDEPGESAVGSTSNPRRAAQIWDPSFPSDCSQVHRAHTEAALSDLACFPQQSRHTVGFDRLPRGADGDVSDPVCLRGARPPPAPGDSFQRFGPPYLGMDGTADCRGLPLRHGATPSAP